MENPVLTGVVHERKQPLLLVADDELLIRMLAREALERAGFAVAMAENGLQAVDAFGRLQPELVLLDVNMPGMDGFAACRQIRQLPGGGRIPVLMMTGLDDLESIRRAYDAGATDFQTKPVNWTILLQRVRYMLRASEAVEGLQRSEARNRALLEAMPDMMFRLDRGGRFLDFKPARGLEPVAAPAQFIGRSIAEVLPGPVSEQCLRRVEKALATGTTQVFEYPLARNGRVREYEARAVVSGENEALAIVRDVTQQKQAARALQRERDFIATVLDTARALVMVRNRQGRIVRFNRACEQVTGYAAAEVERRRAWDFLLPVEEAARERAVFENLLAGKYPGDYQSHWITRDGGRRLIAWSNSLLQDASGEVEHVISTGIDITERRQAEEQVQFLAYYDGLTNLPNRVLFKEHLNQALAYSQRHERLMAVLFFDLDRFKQINDTFGHSLGDLLLKGVAERLRTGVRISDCVARQGGNELETSVGRFGGDEFTIMVTDVASVQSAARIARRVIQAITEPFVLNQQEVFVTASVGISLYPFDGTTAEALLKHADTAMYAAKNQGRDNYHFYSPAMNSKSLNKLSLENDLRRAIGREEFVMHYQPKFQVASGRVVGAEALVRWMHPRKGLLPPLDFIPLAEETGMIMPIGEWCLRAVCRQILAWQQAGLAPVPVSVNISAVHFRQRGLLETVARILRETGVDPTLLELEITESIIMQNEEEADRILRKLKAMGVRISVDDFGTGYSSLSYLKRFTLDALKIDRSFVKDLITDPDDRAITTAIIAMARSLGLKVVAEGVETEQHMDFLREQRCDEVQGYLFSPPLAPGRFAILIAKEPLAFAHPAEPLAAAGAAQAL